MKRRIKGAQIKQGVITDCMIDPDDNSCNTLSNVKQVINVFDENKFNSLFK
jgi:hypothetical protein